MKKVSLTLLTLAGAMYACTNPIENIEVGLKSALATNIELRFKPRTGLMPEAVNVRITGPDADKVVSVLNTRNFRVDEDGVLKLSTLASVVPEAGHPIRFTVVATADKFMEVVQPVTLSDNDQRMVPVTLFSKQGSTPVVEMTAQSDASGSLQSVLTLQTPVGGVSATRAAVIIPQGTQLKDVTDQPVNGSLVARLQPVVVSSAMDLPRGGMLSSGATTDEAVGAQQLTNIAGAVTIDIHNKDYQTVKTFSKPVRLAFAVNQETVNPETNLRIKSGDLIPMFSYDAATDRWQEEAAGLIQKNIGTGQLECVAQVSHLSTWTAAFKKRVCDKGVTFEVKSNFKDYDLPFFCQVVYVDKKGQDQGVASSFYRELIDGSEIRVTDLNRDASVRLKVYENPADLSKFIASKVVKSCDDEADINVRSLKIPATAQAMTFTIQFSCKNVDQKILPEYVVAQFRETGTATWRNLVTLNRKDIKGDLLRGATYKATKNKRYDLRVKVLGFNFEQPGQLIDKNDWLVKIRGQEFCKK